MTLFTRTIKDSLVEHIRDEIIRGNLPPGQRLRQEELAELFQVSTMPVREALRELEAEGLVTIEPRRGAEVTSLTTADLEDIYDIRANLEKMATKLAVPNLTQETLNQLANCLQEMDDHLAEVVAMVKLNHRFHTILYQASSRRHLCDLISILRRRTQHYLHSYIMDLGATPQAQVEHRAILEACQKGEADKAAEIMKQHISNVGYALIEYLQQVSSD